MVRYGCLGVGCGFCGQSKTCGKMRYGRSRRGRLTLLQVESGSCAVPLSRLRGGEPGRTKRMKSEEPILCRTVVKFGAIPALAGDGAG